MGEGGGGVGNVIINILPSTITVVWIYDTFDDNFRIKNDFT